MSLILIVSIVIRLVAMGWSIVLLRRIRDWRIGLMTAMFGLMALRQLLTLLEVKESWAISVTGQATELPGLIVSILAFLVVVFLGRLIRQEVETGEALRKSEQHSRNILDSLFILAGLMTPDGTLIEANKTALEVAGLKPEDVLGKPFEETYWWSYSEPVKQQLREAIRRAAKGEMARYDVVVRVGEDRFITIDFCLQPLFDEAGGVTYLVPSGVDITERKQTEQDLQQAFEYAESIIETTREPLLVLDPDLRIISANRSFYQTFKLTPEESKGRFIYELGDRQWDIPRLRELLEDILPQNTSFNDFEVEHEFTTIGRRVMLLNARRIYRRANKTQMILLAIEDITEHKQAEEALRESEKKYRTIFETTGTATIIIEEDMTISLANSEFEKLSGYSKEELEDKKSWIEFVAKDDLERMKEYHRTRRIDPNAAPRNYEFRFIDREGNVRDIFLAVALIPGTKKSVASLLDITERKRMEKALQESEERYRALLNLEARVGEAVIMLQDTEKGIGIHTFVSDEWPRMTGYSREELLGMSMSDLIHPKYRDASIERYNRRMRGESIPGLFELSIIRKDGTEVPIEITSAYTTYRGKRANVTYIRDITERRKMQEQLMVTDRLASLGELTSGIAHELNNPLTSIIGFSELLLDRDVPDDVKEDLRVIRKEAQRTAGIVKSLLTFARKHPQAKEPVNINKIIQEVLKLRAYEQKVHNIEVNIQFDPDLPEITADAFHLQQVFINIIINAEYFMIKAHERGTLTITTERVGDIIRVSFADDGPGIAEENLGHMFDPFFTTKEVGRGTGLGLSICHGIVTEHGGRIYAKSKPGKGATFIVELPIQG